MPRRLEATEALGRNLVPQNVAKAERELGKIGGRSPSRWELTRAEEHVANLAARGRTNREIADELFVTVKTVEWTLSKVYRKLQVRSRTELAARPRPTEASGDGH